MDIPKEHKFDWKLFAWWVLANTVGVALGVVGIVPAQWLILRRRVQWAGRWTRASSIGMALTVPLVGWAFFAISGFGLSSLPDKLIFAYSGMAAAVLVGTVVGMAQWFVLRRLVQKAGWWIPVNVGAWALAALGCLAVALPSWSAATSQDWLAEALGIASPDRGLLFPGAVGGTVVGALLFSAVTGSVLVRWLGSALANPEHLGGQPAASVSPGRSAETAPGKHRRIRRWAIGFGIVTLVGGLLDLFGFIDEEYLGLRIWYDLFWGNLFYLFGNFIAILGMLGLAGVGIVHLVKLRWAKSPPVRAKSPPVELSPAQRRWRTARRVFWAYLGLCLLLAAGLLLWGPARIWGPLGWETETVASGLNLSVSDESLALDAADRPHISYYDGDYYSLRYAHFDDTGWQVETVPGLECHNPSLVLDAAGRPHISCARFGRRGVMYIWYDGNTRRIQTVDSNTGLDNSLALDATDRPHIGYLGNNGLGLAYYDGGRSGGAGGWQVKTVDGSDVDYDVSLALDAAGRLHISYIGNNKLRYAYCDGACSEGTGSWQFKTVDSTARVDGHTSLALDAAGQPHISYIDDAHGDLKYAHHDSAGWHIQTLANGVHTWGGSSLDLDNQGHPHILYGSHEDLEYATYDGEAWQVEVVAMRSSSGSLVLDAAGQPHIFFRSWPEGVKYAYPATAAKRLLRRGMLGVAVGTWVGLGLALYFWTRRRRAAQQLL